MEIDDTQLALVLAIAIGAIRIIEFLVVKGYTLVMKEKPNGAVRALEKIGNNDLVHIYNEMKSQSQQHEEQIKLLTRIATILECKLK